MKKALIKWGIIALAAALLIGGAVWYFTANTFVSTPMGTAKIDHRIDTSAVTALVVDEGDVLSEETEKIIALYNANWRTLTGQTLAVVTVKSTDNATDEAQQWLERIALDDECSLLLMETEGNTERVLLAQGALKKDIDAQPAGMLDGLILFLVKDGDFDAAALTVFERIHRFVSPVDPGAAMTELVRLLSVIAIIPVLLLVFFVIDKLDTNRARHWYLTCEMSDTVKKPWRPIFPWHTRSSRWFERCLRDLSRENAPGAVPAAKNKRNPQRVKVTSGMMMRRR